MRLFPSAGLCALLLACGDDTSTGGHPGGGEGAGGAGAGSLGGGGEGGVFVPEQGILAEYFEGYYDLALSRVEPGVDHDFMDGGPGEGVSVDRFSARFTGTLTPVESGTYTFITDTDDGVRLWVDGQLIIEDWNGHPVTRNTGAIALTANEPVDIRLDYFEIDIVASVKLSWASETIAEQPIPAGYFTTVPPSGLPGPKPPYANPVVAFDCPDPGVVATTDVDPDGFVAVCTGGQFPIRQSRSLVFWNDTGASILPDGKPPWANNGFRNWAPEIHQVGDQYVAYFTTVDGADVLSIGVASSPSPLGPFVDSGGPLVQHPLGVIDATYFEDEDGSRWLIYKVDGNSQGQPTPIRARQLAADGLSFATGSTETDLLVNDPATWEGGVIEAPWIILRNGGYYLFYSGNVYDYHYRTGVARSMNLLGPYEKLGPPILANNARWVGPGHGSVVTVNQFDYFVYHAWTNAGDDTQLGAAGRQILVDRIDWQPDGWPAIFDGTPSRTPRPWPGEP